MAKASWDVTWTIGPPIQDTTYSVSPTHCLSVLSGKATLWCNVNTNIQNVYVYQSSYHTTHGEPASLVYMYMRMSSKTEASFNGYLISFNSYGFGNYYRYNAGVVTTLVTISGWGGPTWLGGWGKFRMSCINVAGNAVLKSEYWTGAVWSAGTTYTDSSASKILAGGYAGIAMGSTTKIDDVSIIAVV